MSDTITKTVQFETIECPTCHLMYAVSQVWVTERRRDHKNFWCPNGHRGIHFSGESDLERAQRLQEQAERSARFARASATAARDQARAAERSAAAYKGHLTRARNRIRNGVCPVAGCRRHFDNVQAHIASEHPAFDLQAVNA